MLRNVAVTGNDAHALDVTQDHQRSPIAKDDAAPAEHPQRIGRYRVEKVLGKGGFGLVYLAQDEQLNRPVAIKVPHARLISIQGTDLATKLQQQRPKYRDAAELVATVAEALHRTGTRTRVGMR